MRFLSSCISLNRCFVKISYTKYYQSYCYLKVRNFRWKINFNVFFIFLVYSFVALTPMLLRQDGVKYFLSEKLSQDPLEEYFAKQRQRGGSNENPELNDVNRNFLALNVAGDDMVKVMSGNCAGRYREEAAISPHNMSLPPAKKRKIV